jgi:hypothetical protein
MRRAFEKLLLLVGADGYAAYPLIGIESSNCSNGIGYRTGNCYWNGEGSSSLAGILVPAGNQPVSCWRNRGLEKMHVPFKRGTL